MVEVGCVTQRIGDRLDTCMYIQCVSKDAVIHSKLICGKSKVILIKITTIPRLELQAAVLAVRMQTNIA